jgi:hypothetical protein
MARRIRIAHGLSVQEQTMGLSSNKAEVRPKGRQDAVARDIVSERVSGRPEQPRQVAVASQLGPPEICACGPRRRSDWQ